MTVRAVHVTPSFKDRASAAAQHPPVAPKKATRVFAEAINADEGCSDGYAVPLKMT